MSGRLLLLSEVRRGAVLAAAAASFRALTVHVSGGVGTPNWSDDYACWCV